MCRTRILGHGREDYNMILARDEIRGMRTEWAAIMDALEMNHVVPRDVTIRLHPMGVEKGAFHTARDLNAAVGTIDQGPAGNLYLRMLANWCNLIGDDLGDPLIPGELFLSYVNAVSIFDSNSELRVESYGHLVQGLGFSIMNNLSDLQRSKKLLADRTNRENAEDNIAAIFWIGQNNFTWTLRPEGKAVDFLVLNLRNALRIANVGYEERMLHNGHNTLLFTTRWPHSEGARRVGFAVKWASKSDQKTPSIFVPVTPGLQRLQTLPWLATIESEGTLLGGMLPVSAATQGIILQQMWGYEVILTKILERQKAVEAHLTAQAAVTPPPPPADLN